jgi:lysozyme family protein
MKLWDAVIAHTLLVEGGYVNHPNDPGGETKYGITKRSYPNLDIKNLTRDEAIEIYHRDFWLRVPSDLPDGLRWMVFDAAVQHGPSRALGWLAAHPTLLDFTSKRLDFYVALSNWPTFGRGWTRRMASLLLMIGEWERLHAPSATVAGVTLVGLSISDRVTAAVMPGRAELGGAFAYQRAGNVLEVKRVP